MEKLVLPFGRSVREILDRFGLPGVAELIGQERHERDAFGRGSGLRPLHRQLRRDLVEVEVPPADAAVGVAEAHRAVRDDRCRRCAPSSSTVFQAAPSRVVAEVGGGEELARHVRAVLLRPA